MIIKVPMTKLISKDKYNGLNLKLFINHGDSGITTDIINMKPVVNHAMVLAGKLKYFINVG